MTPYVEVQPALRACVPSAIHASCAPRALVPSHRRRRRSRLQLGAFLLASLCVPVDVVGQVSVGDIVRVHDSEGVRVATGRVDRVTRDSLVLDPMSHRPLSAFAADAFRSDSLWLTVRGGSKVGSTALAAGLGGALMGGWLGYCVQLFSASDECARDWDGALSVGAVVGGVSAVVGAVIGLFRFDWEGARFEAARSGPGVHMLPTVAGEGRFGVTASFRFQ